MPDGNDAPTARAIGSIAEIDAAQWDACAVDDSGGPNPFMSHAFLSALEDAGCVGERTGWQPYHMAIEDGGLLIACAAMYLKGNSHGEYVFDHSWAHAYEQAGGRYYPKLQVAAPFSPVPGPRLLARPGAAQEQARLALGATMETVADRLGVSSLHVTFCSEAEARLMQQHGWVLRLGQQFHWHNRGYATFDDFLGALVSRKRKAIRKERREVTQQGIDVRPYVGAEIAPRHWDAFYRFYVDTYDRKWGYPYLNREFFDLIVERMDERVVLMVAELDGRPIAGALNLKGDDTLYGRNWGAAIDVPFLHFEACYYQAIEFAIDHGLARVEAGTQGPHKIQRGYLPVATHSVHYLPNDSFRDAVADFCRHEAEMVEHELTAMQHHSPYRREG